MHFPAADRKTYITYFIIHTINRYHGISRAGNLLQVVLSTGRNFTKENIFTGPATQ